MSGGIYKNSLLLFIFTQKFNLKTRKSELGRKPEFILHLTNRNYQKLINDSAVPGLIQ